MSGAERGEEYKTEKKRHSADLRMRTGEEERVRPKLCVMWSNTEHP